MELGLGQLGQLHLHHLEGKYFVKYFPENISDLVLVQQGRRVGVEGSHGEQEQRPHRHLDLRGDLEKSMKLQVRDSSYEVKPMHGWEEFLIGALVS